MKAFLLGVEVGLLHVEVKMSAKSVTVLKSGE